MATKASDEDPPETLVLKRGRKQVCCVGPCSRSLKSDSRKTWAKQNREGEYYVLAPLTRVWYYFLFLFHETHFFTETYSCADGRSVVPYGAVASAMV